MHEPLTYEYPDSMPGLSLATAALYVATVITYAVAASRLPLERLRATGLPIATPHFFIVLGFIVLALLGLYAYRLMARPVQPLALVLRLGVLVGLVGHTVGWAAWAHSSFVVAAVAFVIGAAAVTMVLVAAEARTCREYAGPHTLLTPCTADYVMTNFPVSTFGGWLWALGYVATAGALYDGGTVSSPDAVANVLLLFLLIVLVPYALFMHGAHMSMLWLVVFSTLASGVDGSALHALLWASVGAMGVFTAYGTHARFVYHADAYVRT